MAQGKSRSAPQRLRSICEVLLPHRRCDHHAAFAKLAVIPGAPLKFNGDAASMAAVWGSTDVDDARQGNQSTTN
jgi:hypothetical protein